MASKLVTPMLQTTTDLLVIVDFSVEDSPHSLVFVRYWLGSRWRKIENTKTSMYKPGVFPQLKSVTIGTTVTHGQKGITRIDLSLWKISEPPGNTAHITNPSSQLRDRRSKSP